MAIRFVCVLLGSSFWAWTACAQIVADFSVDTTLGWYPFTVTFANGSTYPPDPNVSFFWDFGDGQFSTSKNPTHVYTEAGIFSVSLAVHAFGEVGEITKQSLVTSLKLDVDFTASPTSGTPPLPVSFTNTTTPDGWPYGYLWIFGDGQTSTLESPQHVYAIDGSYDVTLEVTPPVGTKRQLTREGYVQVRTEPFLQLAHSCAGPTFEFPRVETPVSIGTESGLLCELDISDFSVTEDGVPQTIESVQCGISGELSAADFVFVIDRSGSMGIHFDGVRTESAGFAADAVAAGIDAQFGLVSYVRTGTGDQVLELPLTPVVDDFADALDNVFLEGGTEPALDSVVFALENMDFRPCARRIIVLITDETTNGDTLTMPEAIDAVLAAGATVVAVSPDFDLEPISLTGPGDNIPDRTRATETDVDVRILAEETNGFWVDIVDADYSVILDELVDFVVSIWMITYTSINPEYDGTARDVVVTVYDPFEGIDSVAYTYEAPILADYVRDHFRALDDNRDGRISGAESGFSLASFSGMDLNGDGFVTLAELMEQTLGPVGATAPVWVDFTYEGLETGESTLPFNTLDEALAFVTPGGDVHVDPGQTALRYTGAYALRNPVRISSTGGAVRIGVSTPRTDSAGASSR